MSEVTVVLSVNEVSITKVSQEVELTSPGPQGPPGPQGNPGAAGGSVYIHTQSSPAGSWIVNHGLNRPAFITVLNSAGEEIITDVDQSDPNTASIIFATPTSGKAVVS